MKQDRFLTGILIGIGLLVVVALVLFFTRQDKRDYVSDESPEAVTHNFVLAVVRKDYEKAYSYLADLENKPAYEEFRQSFFNGAVNPGNVGVDIGRAEISGDEAVVELSLIYSPGDPFSSGHTSIERALLVRQSGRWKLSAMPTYSLWDYSWYQEPFKP